MIKRERKEGRIAILFYYTGLDILAGAYISYKLYLSLLARRTSVYRGRNILSTYCSCRADFLGMLRRF